MPNTSRSVVEQAPQPRDREAAPAQVGEHLQLEDVERRIAALGEAAGFGAVRRDAAENSRRESHHCSCRAVRPVSAATSREV